MQNISKATKNTLKPKVIALLPSLFPTKKYRIALSNILYMYIRIINIIIIKQLYAFEQILKRIKIDCIKKRMNKN